MRTAFRCALLISSILVLALNAALVLASSPQPAHTMPAASAAAPPAAGTDDIDHRIALQKDRIDKGIKANQLTEAEARTLHDNLAYIQQQEANLKAQGALDKEAKERLNKMLDQNSKMIQDKRSTPVKPMKDTHLQNRFDSQQERIDRGVLSGALTKDEARILQDNLDKIKTEEASLKKAGKLTDQEKKRIEKMLDQNSNMIKDKATNPVKRL
jgi:hypothetical protein